MRKPIVCIFALALASCAIPPASLDPEATLVTSFVRDAPLVESLGLLAAQAGCRVESSDTRKSLVSWNFKKARLDDVLDNLGQAYGFRWHVDSRRPCVIRIDR